MISAAEKEERREAIRCVIGTNRAEGIEMDALTLAIMEQYAEGEISLQEFSASMQSYAESLGAVRKPLVHAA